MVNEIIRNIHIPQSHGGRLRAPLTPIGQGYYSMHDFHRLTDDVLIYAVHRAGAYAHDPRYRVFLCDMVNWWQRFRQRRQTSSSIKGLVRDSLELHARAEGILPTACLTWCMHFFTHLAESLAFCGTAPVWSMYAWERTGSFVANATNTSHDLEAGIIDTYILRELCSFLRVHDPTIFRYTDSTGTGMVTRTARDLLVQSDTQEWSVDHPRWLVFEQAEFERICSYYRGLSTLTRAMDHALSQHGSALTTGHLSYVRDYAQCKSTRCGRKTIKPLCLTSSVPAWERGYCTIEYSNEEGEFRYGTVIRIIRQKPFNHPLSPEVTILEVVEWMVVSGSTSLMKARPPARFPQQPQTLFVNTQEVTSRVFLFKPCIPADRTRVVDGDGGNVGVRHEGTRLYYTHNILFIGG